MARTPSSIQDLHRPVVSRVWYWSSARRCRCDRPRTDPLSSLLLHRSEPRCGSNPGDVRGPLGNRGLLSGAAPRLCRLFPPGSNAPSAASRRWSACSTPRSSSGPWRAVNEAASLLRCRLGPGTGTRPGCPSQTSCARPAAIAPRTFLILPVIPVLHVLARRPLHPPVFPRTDWQPKGRNPSQNQPRVGRRSCHQVALAAPSRVKQEIVNTEHRRQRSSFKTSRNTRGGHRPTILKSRGRFVAVGAGAVMLFFVRGGGGGPGKGGTTNSGSALGAAGGWGAVVAAWAVSAVAISAGVSLGACLRSPGTGAASGAGAALLLDSRSSDNDG